MEEIKKEDHAKEQAAAQLSSIKSMLDDVKAAEEIESEKEREEKTEEAREAITEDALEAGKLNQYFILLCTGGPAVRIVGNLDDHNEPETARLEYQDWGTPWTAYPCRSDDEDALLEYARYYYFGE